MPFTITSNRKAKYFAEEISKINEIKIDPESVQTNIVIFSSAKISKNELIGIMKENGVLISSGSYENLRAVFHMDVSKDDLDNAISIFKSLLK